MGNISEQKTRALARVSSHFCPVRRANAGATYLGNSIDPAIKYVRSTSLVHAVIPIGYRTQSYCASIAAVVF